MQICTFSQQRYVCARSRSVWRTTPGLVAGLHCMCMGSPFESISAKRTGRLVIEPEVRVARLGVARRGRVWPLAVVRGSRLANE